ARAFIEGHPSDREILIVGASRGAADDLARVIATRRGAAFGLHRFSLVQLAAVLALTQAGNNTAPTTLLGSVAIAARVSYQARLEGVLNYYSPVVQFPGFPGTLARTLGELRLAGIAPAGIESAAQGDV